MTPGIWDASQTRRTYDHRLREHVVRCGTIAPAKHVQIPRSTVSTWRRRGLRPVFTTEPFDQEKQNTLDSSARWEKRARVLAAVVRLLLALLHASSFSLNGNRLPEGKAKAGILCAITCVEVFLPLATILRIIGLEPGRYHAWRRAENACGLTDRSSCPRTSPGQLTDHEVATVKEMVLAPEYRHMPLGTLARYAQRIGKVFASASTWAKLVRERGWRRPRQRVHPPKPTVGVRASQPNQIWHIDTSVIKLVDGTKVYLQAVLDNFSRKILAWTVMERFDASKT
jgi:putative transposase